MVQLILTLFGFYGIISNDTTWSDTAYLTGDVLVQPGVTLTITPGTVVLYADTCEWDTVTSYINLTDIIIFGNLKAIGSQQDSIVFKSENENKQMQGGIETNGGWDSLSYCFIKGGEGISGQNSRLNINQSDFSEISNCGVSLEEGVLNIANSVCSEIQKLGEKWSYHGAINVLSVDSCIISNTRVEGVSGISKKLDGGSAAGIFCADSRYVKIENSILKNIKGGYGDVAMGPLSGGVGSGLDFYRCSSVVVNNNQISGIVGGDANPSDIDGSWGGHGFGLWIWNCSNLLLENNQVSGIFGGHGTPCPNDEMDGPAEAIYCHNSSPAIANNTFNGVGTYIYIDSLSHPIIGGEEGKGNRFLKNQGYVISNDSPYDIDATWNFWECEPFLIDSLIYDHYDDPTKGIVHYDHATGIKEEEVESSPEPFSIASTVVHEFFYISLPKGGGPSIIELFDSSGRRVMTKSVSETNVGIDVSRFPKGIYFVKLVPEERAKRFKILIF